MLENFKSDVTQVAEYLGPRQFRIINSETTLPGRIEREDRELSSGVDGDPPPDSSGRSGSGRVVGAAPRGRTFGNRRV